jgi:hypothetical protein
MVINWALLVYLQGESFVSSSWDEQTEIGAHFSFPSYCKQNGQETLIYQQCLSARRNSGVCVLEIVLQGGMSSRWYFMVFLFVNYHHYNILSWIRSAFLIQKVDYDFPQPPSQKQQKEGN